MTLEELVVAIARVVGSLLVVRWAFVGGVAAVLVDLAGLFMKNLLDLGGVRNYQAFDKWLDQVYMAAFLLVALRWTEPARRIALALYAYRLAGFVLFEVTQARALLVLFPNLFEFWFLFVAALPHVRPVHGFEESSGAEPSLRRSSSTQGREPRTAFAFTQRNVAIALALLLAAKLTQEIVIHWLRLLDSFTAVEAVERIVDVLVP